MADQALHLASDAELETALRGLADAIAWPSSDTVAGAPDIAAAVRTRLEQAPLSRERPGRWSWPHLVRGSARRALVIAVILLLVLAALAGAAGLGLPGLRIFFGGTTGSPPPVVTPASSATAGAGSSASATPGTSVPVGSALAPTGPGANLGLGERIALADLDARAGFHVILPTDPAFGPPDNAWIDPAKAGQVTLVWAPRPGLPATLDPGVGLLVTEFRGMVEDAYFSKALGAETTVELVLVGDDRGFWLHGDPHQFFYQGPTGFIEDQRRWVGDALLWASGPITYRMETSLGRDEAIRIAGTMR